MIKELTSDGSNIADWGKCTSRTFPEPIGDLPGTLLLQSEEKSCRLQRWLQDRLQREVDMRVRCGKVVSSTTGELLESSPWLRVDGEYVVLAIEMVPDRRILFRLVGDDGDVPGLFEAEMFVTVSPNIPSTWIVAVHEGGGMDLAPKRWLAPGFWEQYFDRDQSAIAIFEEEKTKILRES